MTKTMIKKLFQYANIEKVVAIDVYEEHANVIVNKRNDFTLYTINKYYLDNIRLENGLVKIHVLYEKFGLGNLFTSNIFITIDEYKELMNL